MKKILFVCLGNICRSASAHGIFRALVERAGREKEFEIDSAGTGDWHVGEPPDPRAQAACARAGFDIADLRARQVRAEDFQNFDLICACDAQNLRDLQALAPADSRARLALLMSFSAQEHPDEVPDPYYGSSADFDRTVRYCRQACQGLLA